MNKAFPIVFILLFLSYYSFGQPIIIKDPKVQLIGEHIYFYEDDSRELTLSQAIERRHDFEKSDQEAFAHYATPSKFWFYFSIENQTDVDLWIDIANSNLTYIDLYTLDKDFNLIDSLHTGCLSTEEKKMKGYTFQSLLVKRDQKEKLHFFLKVETLLVYEVPLFVGSVEEIMSNRNLYDFASIFVVGAFVLMMLYNVFLFFVTKDNIYIYYSFYLITAIIIGTYLNNFPFIEEFIGKTLSFVYLDTWLWLIFFATALFTIRYFDLRRTDRTFYKAIIAVTLLLFSFGIANLFMPLYYLANLFQIVALLFYAVCLVFSYRLLIRGVERARLYCLGWSFMMLGAILYLFVYNGLLPYNAFTRNVAYIGSLLEILIFSIALGRRITVLQAKQVELNQILKSKNDELVDLNESLDSFNYHVSHDLKTVLNNTLALSRMAIKYNSKNDTKRVNEIIEKLENVAINGSETVQSFLSLGRLDTILHMDNQKLINLQDELDSVVIAHDIFGLIQIRIERDNIGRMKMHPKLFETIFLNLITNSIKYNKQAPKAWIDFLTTDEGYVFIYRDNGIGLDLEKFGNEIFKPFQRIGVDSNYEGTGLGLYLVKRIVSSLNGQITVKSDLDVGTEFTIKFVKTV